MSKRDEILLTERDRVLAFERRKEEIRAKIAADLLEEKQRNEELEKQAMEKKLNMLKEIEREMKVAELNTKYRLQREFLEAWHAFTVTQREHIVLADKKYASTLLRRFLKKRRAFRAHQRQDHLEQVESRIVEKAQHTIAQGTTRRAMQAWSKAARASVTEKESRSARVDWTSKLDNLISLVEQREGVMPPRLPEQTQQRETRPPRTQRQRGSEAPEQHQSVPGQAGEARVSRPLTRPKVTVTVPKPFALSYTKRRPSAEGEGDAAPGGATEQAKPATSQRQTIASRAEKMKEHREKVRQRRLEQEAELQAEIEAEAAEQKAKMAEDAKKRREQKAKRERAAAARKKEDALVYTTKLQLRFARWRNWTHAMAKAQRAAEKFDSTRLQRRVMSRLGVSLMWRREEERQAKMERARVLLARMMTRKYLLLLRANVEIAQLYWGQAVTVHRRSALKANMTCWHEFAHAETVRKEARRALDEQEGARYRRRLVQLWALRLLFHRATATRATRMLEREVAESVDFVRSRAQGAWDELMPARGVWATRVSREFERGLPFIELSHAELPVVDYRQYGISLEKLGR
ncbi:hypothetical protein J8273_3411 [Carpediemonas membranifera]|uniref:Uncharacterized protein n=1 Tax=Carpediemonas membranifera TaxID=201153 RepID=A0A8J6E1B9_9EUKA|nr:hypothetical protein J8273_3411 [Carpediemonas membranifera]|eukprot:KAG9393278.1 hypothetical protein J8273_3411 [Carpediemonas membranifera]